MPGQIEAQEVGQLTLASPSPTRGGLEPVGENMLVETGAVGPVPVVAAPLAMAWAGGAGASEASNVNVVQELVDMIETQRAYEISSKTISASDEMCNSCRTSCDAHDPRPDPPAAAGRLSHLCRGPHERGIQPVYDEAANSCRRR